MRGWLHGKRFAKRFKEGKTEVKHHRYQGHWRIPVRSRWCEERRVFGNDHGPSRNLQDWMSTKVDGC